MKKVLGKMVVVIALMLITTIIYHVDCQWDIEKRMNIAKEKEKKLQAQLLECEKALQEAAKTYVKEIGAKPCVLLCFDAFEKSSYGAIIETMDRYEMQGIIVFRDGKIPGTQGGITVELYRELLDKGWEGAIGNSALINVYDNFPDVKKQEWSEYIAMMQTAFREQNLEVPNIYIPHEGEVVSEIVDLFSEYQLNAYIRLEETFADASTEMGIASLTEMGAIVGKYEYENLSNDVASLIPMAESVAIFFVQVESGAPSNKQHTSYLALDAQLERLSMLGEYVNVTTFSEYQAYQQRVIDENKVAYQKYSDEQNLWKEQIQSLKKQIEENYAMIFGE